LIRPTSLFSHFGYNFIVPFKEDWLSLQTKAGLNTLESRINDLSVMPLDSHFNFDFFITLKILVANLMDASYTRLVAPSQTSQPKAITLHNLN
jgi:hypothetical protein